VRPFPGPGTQWQISTSGGWVPTWSRRGNELFYLSPDSHLMAVSYTVEGNTFRAGAPQKWSEQPVNGRPGPRPFDLHPDGDRVVVSGDRLQFLRRSAKAAVRRHALARPLRPVREQLPTPFHPLRVANLTNTTVRSRCARTPPRTCAVQEKGKTNAHTFHCSALRERPACPPMR
jgi:hypothetical protein